MLGQNCGTPKCLGTPRYINTWSAPWEIQEFLGSGTPKYLGGGSCYVISTQYFTKNMVNKIIDPVGGTLFFWYADTPIRREEMI